MDDIVPLEMVLDPAEAADEVDADAETLLGSLEEEPWDWVSPTELLLFPLPFRGGGCLRAGTTGNLEPSAPPTPNPPPLLIMLPLLLLLAG